MSICRLSHLHTWRICVQPILSNVEGGSEGMMDGGMEEGWRRDGEVGIENSKCKYVV